MSRFEDAIAAAKSPPASAGAKRFAEALAGVRPSARATFTLNGIEIECWVTPLGSEVEIGIEAEVQRIMRGHELEQNVLNEDFWQRARISRTLARAVVDSDAVGAKPLASASQWGDVPISVQNQLMRIYIDLRDSFDPDLENISQRELEDMLEAALKKNGALLRKSGARRLAIFVLTLVDQLESSQTQKSLRGAMSPDSSSDEETETETETGDEPTAAISAST